MTDVVVASCVSGGIPGRLAESMARAGAASSISYHADRDSWQAAMTAGGRRRVTMRAAIMTAFPLRLVLQQVGRRRRPGVVVATTNPFVLPVALGLTRRVHRQRVVMLVYDLYPDAFEATSAAPPRLLVRLMEMITRSAFRRSDGVVFIGESMAKSAIARYGEPRRWTIIETGASSAELGGERRPSTPFLEELDTWIGDRELVSYVGNLGRTHDWSTFADGLRLLADDERATSALAVLIAASGPGADVLRAVAVMLPPGFMRVIGPVDDDDWAGVLQRSAISVVTLREGAADASVPSKTFSALAAGCAVVAVAPPSDVADLVTATGCGAVVAPGSSAAFADVLLGYADDPDALHGAQENARAAATSRFELDQLTIRWLEFIESLPTTAMPV